MPVAASCFLGALSDHTLADCIAEYRICKYSASTGGESVDDDPIFIALSEIYRRFRFF